MTVKECIELYDSLGVDVFSASFSERWARYLLASEKYDSLEFEKKIKMTLAAKHLSPNVKLTDLSDSSRPRVCGSDATYSVLPRQVCVIARSQSGGIHRFRNYDLGTGGESACAVWEALRATSAAPSFFSPAVIGGQTYVDGGLGANNPIDFALDEAMRCVEKGRQIACLVSLGCGTPCVATEVTTRLGWAILPWKGLWDVLLSEATQSDHTALTFKNSLSTRSNIHKYYRFDMGGVNMKLDDVGFLPTLKSAAETYVEQQRDDLLACARLLSEGLPFYEASLTQS